MKDRKHEAKIAFSVDDDLRKQLKMKTIQENTTIKELITAFVKQYVEPQETENTL